MAYLNREEVLRRIDAEVEWLKAMKVHNLEKNLNRTIVKIIETTPTEDCVPRSEYDKVVAELDRVRNLLCTVEAMERLADKAEQLAADYDKRAGA